MKNSSVEIGVQLTDVFTQSLCSELIVEIVKFIIYQKQLIPFPLDHLKLCIARRKSVEQNIRMDRTSSRDSRRGSAYLVEKHLKKTVDSLDLLDTMFQSIISEIENCDPNDLKEVLLVLGATILSPQSVFRIKIPRIEKLHSEKHHPSRKQLFNVLRSLIGTSNFADLMCKEISSKNLFIFLKLDASYRVRSSYLLPKDNFSLPLRAQESIINILTSDGSSENCCCSGVKIFNDSNIETTPARSSGENAANSVDITTQPNEYLTSWYQFKSPFVGFKDEKVNGVSVVNSWIKS